VEIPIEADKELDYATASAAFKRTGLKCSTCGVKGPGHDLAYEDEAIQKGGIAYLKLLVDAAVIMRPSL
jgi:hypothetical protein